MALVEKDLVANVDTEWSVLELRMAVVVAKVTSNKRKFIKMSMVNKTVTLRAYLGIFTMENLQLPF